MVIFLTTMQNHGHGSTYCKYGNSHAKTDETNYQTNEQFSYCLQGGQYLIKDIFFVGKGDDKDRGVDFPKITFEVIPNHSTIWETFI